MSLFITTWPLPYSLLKYVITFITFAKGILKHCYFCSKWCQHLLFSMIKINAITCMHMYIILWIIFQVHSANSKTYCEVLGPAVQEIVWLIVFLFAKINIQVQPCINTSQQVLNSKSSLSECAEVLYSNGSKNFRHFFTTPLGKGFLLQLRAVEELTVTWPW